MDPISALTVAAAVVQFVDFSMSIVCKTKDIYNSIDGVTMENKETETVTIRLKEMAKELQMEKPGFEKHTSPRLKSICVQCVAASDELVSRLSRLTVPDGSVWRRWKSFRQALKSVWSKEIDAMAQRLNVLRSEIDSEVLTFVRDLLMTMSKSHKDRFSGLNSQTQKILEELLKIESSQQSLSQWSEELNMEHKAQLKCLVGISIAQNIQFQKLDDNTRRIITTMTDMKRMTANHLEALTESELMRDAKLRDARLRAVHLVEQDGEKRAARVYLDILESLRFHEMTHRHDSIPKAHTETFKWVFNNPAANQKPWDSFCWWLSQDSGIYWIQGKPASGKSTLMSFIWHHQSTMKELIDWSKKATLITGAFFFWNSGFEEQRSQAGILRTLLHEILKAQRNLVSRAFPEEWARKSELAANDMAITPEKWSLEQLQTGLRNVVGLASSDLKFCFFIDGLDEYDGDHGEIAEYIDELSAISPHAKFCVSSRPLPVIQAVFQDTRGLKLHDLTHDDIATYVRAELGGNRSMKQLLHRDVEGGQWLIDEIVRRAAGVFLWVVLVVKSLIKGLRNHDGVAKLRQRLLALPVDLENLFEHMLAKIDPEYKVESSKIFQIFRASDNQLRILELYYALYVPDHHRAIELGVESLVVISGKAYQEQLDNFAEDMIIRLQSRCRGLLEVCDTNRDLEEEHQENVDDFHGDDAVIRVVNSPNPLPEPSPGMGPAKTSFERRSRRTEEERPIRPHEKLISPNEVLATELEAEPVPAPKGRLHYVVYLHRTAREYLEKPHVWNGILVHTSSKFDPKLSILTAFVLQAKWVSEEFNYDASCNLFKRASRLKLPTSLLVNELVDESDRTLNLRSRENGGVSRWSMWTGRSITSLGDG